MRNTFVLLLTLAAASNALASDQPMYVSLCSQTGVAEQMLSGAKEEVEIAYQEVGAVIHWVGCHDMESAEKQYGDRFFVIRLRKKAFLANPRSVSLDSMGRAYTDRRGSGYLADVYLSSLAHFGDEFEIDFNRLLGLVISHELGHLLLGPGHSTDGIMVAKWTRHETEAGRKRWLRFDKEQAAMIIEQLRVRGMAAR